MNDIYSPIDESQQLYGVFYIYTDDSELNSYKMEPIGLNFFNRPGAQNGFALKMSHNADLNSMRNVKKIFSGMTKMRRKQFFNEPTRKEIIP